MTTHPNLSRLEAWFERWISQREKTSEKIALLPLAGDGSTRTFYRATANGISYVLVSDPAWVMTRDYAPHQEFLQTRGIPTPEFLAVDPSAGVLVMEDLGDELLQFRIQNSTKDKKEHWLTQATKLLAQLHDLTFPVPNDIPAATRAFDETKYSDELFFTETHLLKGLFGLPGFSPAEKSSVMAFSKKISSFRPYVFSHRDYHTRNIIISHESLFLIDFQDARLGSPHYDLASLLFDPYVELSALERKQLLQVYQNALGASPLFEAISWATFEFQLHAVALQRVLKAAGSFAYFFTHNKKSTHLKYILPALRSALFLAETCASAPDGVELGLNLAEYLELAKEHIEITASLKS